MVNCLTSSKRFFFSDSAVILEDLQIGGNTRSDGNLYISTTAKWLYGGSTSLATSTFAISSTNGDAKLGQTNVTELCLVGDCKTTWPTDTNDTGLYYTKTEFNTQNSTYYSTFLTSYTETDTLALASITVLNNTKLNNTDQRYNETTLILSVNTTTNIQGLGFYTSIILDNFFSSINNNLTTATNNLQANITSVNNTATLINNRADTLNNTKASTGGTTCSGTDKISAISLNAQTININCTTDTTGTGGGSDLNYTNGLNFSGSTLTINRLGMTSLTATIPNEAINITIANISGVNSKLKGDYRYFTQLEQDFLLRPAVGTFLPWYGTATGTGTVALTAADSDHPGIINLSTSTTANSGYALLTDTNVFRLAGREQTTIIFRPSLKAANATRIFMGFIDSNAASTAIVDGVYINVTGNITVGLRLEGIAQNNSIQVRTASSYTLAGNTWYRVNITIVNTTFVQYELYNNTGLLWTDNTTSGVPLATGRETGHGISAGVIGSAVASGLVEVDYMNAKIERVLNR